MKVDNPLARLHPIQVPLYLQALTHKLIAKKGAVPLIWALVVLCVGFLITPHYGESWDELKFYKYADSALQAYTTWPTKGTVPFIGNTYDNYGPVYVMTVALVSRLLDVVLPWIESDIRHLLYFFTFAAGIWAFYKLSRRWFTFGAAAGATILFAAQPLLWGHAFISPKDIPFLSLFMLTLHFGMEYFDKHQNEASLAPKRTLTILTVTWLVFIAGLIGGTGLIYSWLEGTIRAASAGQNNFFMWVASDLQHVEPEIYIQKYFVLFIQLRAVFLLLLTIYGVFLYQKHAPEALRSRKNLILPGILLGLTVCIRILGPLAGLIVAMYAMHKHGRRALPNLLIYTGIAIAAMYATWPYLWPDPVGHFIESIIVMAKYPWQGQVLFNGQMFASDSLPGSYLPVLFGIQLTEPVWILFVVGLGLVAWRAALGSKDDIQLLSITFAWFILPITVLILLHSPLYDNFRQVFFLLPPVFMMAGAFFDRIGSARWRLGLVLACVLPGIVAGIRLHPYEYTYYNSLIGGQAGAFRKYEMDYWGISYREAANWLNQHASPNANLWAEGPSHLLGLYLRPDLRVYSAYEDERAESYEYTVATSRRDLDIKSYPQAPVVHAISREGAILTVIKQP